MSITRLNWSGVSRVAGTAVPTPALLTRISMRPMDSTAAATNCRQSSGSETSARTARARRPSRSTALRVASRRSARRAARTTSAPAWASASAKATPSPEEAPVTIATRPSSRKRSRTDTASIGPGQAEHVLADLVQDHLVVDRRKAHEARRSPERHQVVLVGDAIPAVDLDALVDGAVGCLAGQPLGRVGEPRGRAVPAVEGNDRFVVERAGRRQLRPERCQGVLDRLVAADRRTEGGADLRVLDGPGKAVEAKNVGDRGNQDSLRVEGLKHGADAVALDADQVLGGYRDRVEDHVVLALRRPRIGGQG